MYTSILVAFDGTVAGEAALQEGADLAWLCKCDLHVLAVVVTSGGMLLDPAVVSTQLLDAERQFLGGALDEAARKQRLRGIAVTTVIRDGQAASEIMAYTHEIKPGLLVIGHSHKGLLARWLEGSVGERILDDMPCSLLVATDVPRHVKKDA